MAALTPPRTPFGALLDTNCSRFGMHPLSFSSSPEKSSPQKTEQRGANLFPTPQVAKTRFDSSPQKPSPLTPQRFSPYKKPPTQQPRSLNPPQDQDLLKTLNDTINKAIEVVNTLNWRYRTSEGERIFFSKRELKPLVKKVKTLIELQRKLDVASVRNAAMPLLLAYNKITVLQGLDQFRGQLAFEKNKLHSLREMAPTPEINDQIDEAELSIEQLQAKIRAYELDDPYYLLEHLKVKVNLDKIDPPELREATKDEVDTTMFIVRLYQNALQKKVISRPHDHPEEPAIHPALGSPVSRRAKGSSIFDLANFEEPPPSLDGRPVSLFSLFDQEEHTS